MKIRPASKDDAAAIAGIWNQIIRAPKFSFNSLEKPVPAVRSLIAEKHRSGHPILVAEAVGIIGFATYGQFRQGVGYAQTMEHTIHLAPDSRGRGTGRALMSELERLARQREVRSMIAGICGENDGAVAFHCAIGYTEIARLPQVGFKYGRWLDLVLMQKFLDR